MENGENLKFSNDPSLLPKALGKALSPNIR